MVVGTSSHVGKSIVAAAFCRILQEDGYHVAPFKAQNMSLNSAVTPSGREIGRAQAVQAEACRILPNEHMNPVLLKPSGHMESQIVLQGRPLGIQSARDFFFNDKDLLWNAVVESYDYLAQRYDVIVIEGAGSPVEMNLKDRDIGNMKTALMANAEVILVADIDRGGVFASVVGTLQLLSPEERRLVKGIVINKFRGEAELFAEGRRWLEEYTGIPVIGVLPYLQNLDIDEEDSVGLAGDRYQLRPTDSGGLRIAIISLPHISNFTDFDPLFLEPDVEPYFCQTPAEVSGADAIVIPGTKSTVYDLLWLHEEGWTDAISSALSGGARVLGICGGYQMLGKYVYDPKHYESEITECPGLGLLDAQTTIQADKATVLVEGVFQGLFAGIQVEGYEIHMGITEFHSLQRPLAITRPKYTAAAKADAPVMERSVGQVEGRPEGHVTADGLVIGTYLHGVLHNDEFRTAWLNEIRRAKGLPLREVQVYIDSVREQALNRLATTVREHIDMDQIYHLLCREEKQG